MKLEKLHQYILDKTDLLVLVLDEDLVLRDTNQTARQFFSKKGFVTGKKITDFVTESAAALKRKLQSKNEKIKIIFSFDKGNIINALAGKHLQIAHDKRKCHILLLKQRFEQLELIDEGKVIANIDPLEKILQNIDIVFYRVKVDPDGKKNLFFISSHVTDIFGLSYRDYMKLMKNGKILQYFHKDDYAKILKTNKEIFDNKKPSQVIYRFFNPKKKKYIWIEEKGYPVLNGKNQLVEMYGIARDVNDRIESEISLSKTASFYKNIIEENLSGFYRISTNSVILEANNSFARALGYKNKKQIIGKRTEKLYKISTDEEHFIDTIIRKKKLINHESHVTLYTGEEKFFLENTSYFKNPHTGEEHIEGTIFDITEFKKTQLALKRSEAKYKKLFEENLVGVFRTNVKGHIYDCNSSFCRIFGYKTKNDLLKGTSLQFYRSKVERDRYLRDLRSKNILKNYEMQYRKKDGSDIWALLNVELIKEGREEIIQGTLIDITQQRIINNKLVQNVDKYRKLFENASDAIFLVRDWKITDCNHTSLKLFKSTKKELLGKKFSDLISYPDLNREQKKLYDRIFVQRSNFNSDVYHCVLKNKKGEKIFAEIAVSMVTENNEDLYQLIVHDNTRQIHEQRELENSMQNFENLVERSPDGNIIIHQDKVIFSNSAAINIFNLRSKKDILGKNITSFFVAEHQPEIQKLIHFVKEKKSNTRFYEYRITNKGKQMEVGIQLIHLRYGDLDCVNMIVYDLELKKQLAQQELRANIAEEANRKLEKEISNHKETQNRLSDQIAMTQALLEGSQNVLIYTLDRKLKLTSYNSIFEKTSKMVFGQEIHLGENFAAFMDGVVTPDDRAIMHERFNRAFMGESVRLEGPLRMKNGGIVWIETFINPIKKANQIIEISCISTDITDKKLKNEELRNSLREKEVLLKEVHHRVKNNLQIISSILNLQTSFSNDTRVNEILRESQNRVKSMAYLHESLYQNKNFSFINFSDYLINLSKNLVHSYYISANSVDLKLDVDKVDLNLDQAIPCGLIINELLTNAIKYAFPDNEKGGVISISVKEKKGLVEISVADNGKGLPKSFDVNKTNSLGLQLVSTLTEQLDGKLVVQNQTGAKFTITFKKI